MKTQLNEIRRMQKLAGILKEEDMGYTGNSPEDQVTGNKTAIEELIKTWPLKAVEAAPDVFGESLIEEYLEGNIPGNKAGKIPEGQFNSKMEEALIELSKGYHTGTLTIEQAVDKAIQIVTDPSNYN
jgi:hypothetical protein